MPHCLRRATAMREREQIPRLRDYTAFLHGQSTLPGGLSLWLLGRASFNVTLQNISSLWLCWHCLCRSLPRAPLLPLHKPLRRPVSPVFFVFTTRAAWPREAPRASQWMARLDPNRPRFSRLAPSEEETATLVRFLSPQARCSVGH